MAKTNATLIWNIAELLRGPFQPNQYGDVVLPFTILRRLDCILEPTKEQVIAAYKQAQSQKIDPSLFARICCSRIGWSFGSMKVSEQVVPGAVRA